MSTKQNVFVGLPEKTVATFTDAEDFANHFLYHWEDIGKEGFAAVVRPISTPEQSRSYVILKHLFSALLKHCKGDDKEKTILAVYVKEYNDIFYKDIYRLHYSNMHFPYKDMCGRVFLFDFAVVHADSSNVCDIQRAQEAFIGTIVRRPLPGHEIGRTLINPAYVVGNSGEAAELTSNVLTNCYEFMMYGIPLTVDAFPFSMQDGEVTTCAETTILNMMDYYSWRYNEYKAIMPSDIVDVIRRNSNTRNLPSAGLSYEQISRVFLGLGFSPVLYFQEKMRHDFAKYLHANVASGLPVAMAIENTDGTEGHSIIVIGTESRLVNADEQSRRKSFDDAYLWRKARRKSENRDEFVRFFIKEKSAFSNRYIVMDDSQMPYTSVEIVTLNGKLMLQYTDGTIKYIKCFLSPLSKNMTMDVKDAIDKFYALLTNDTFSYSSFLEKMEEKIDEQDDRKVCGIETSSRAGLDSENPIMTRIFLCSSRRLKEQRVMRYLHINDEETLRVFRSVHLPRYIWVCEIYTRESYCNKEGAFPVGEIILDATSASTNRDDKSSLIWINYLGKCAYRLRGEEESAMAERMREKVEKNEENILFELLPFVIHTSQAEKQYMSYIGMSERDM